VGFTEADGGQQATISIYVELFCLVQCRIEGGRGSLPEFFIILYFMDYQANKQLFNKDCYSRQSVKGTIKGKSYFADLRMTFRQKCFLQDWFRNLE
jgi:hypothetical protein